MSSPALEVIKSDSTLFRDEAKSVGFGQIYLQELGYRISQRMFSGLSDGAYLLS